MNIAKVKHRMYIQGMKVKFHTFQECAIVGGECLASHFDSFTYLMRQEAGWVSAGKDVMAQNTIHAPTWNQIPTVQLLGSHFTDRAILNHKSALLTSFMQW